MPVIQLIVTGDTERLALVDALRAVLPAERGGEPVRWATPHQEQEPTKNRLRPLKQSPDGLVQKLADTLVRFLSVGTLPDLVLAVGDVELHNLDQERVVLEHLRAALRVSIQSAPTPGRPTRAPDEQAALAARLRERGAFHLLRPMVEASFFGDRPTLERAGVPTSTTPALLARDVEDFESTDPGWLPECIRRNQSHHREGRRHWRHERHAAEYLAHLVERGPEGLYNKTRHGTAALRALPWVEVIDAEPSPYLRALFGDLAGWFGVPCPLRAPLAPGPLAPTHPDATPAADRILRNL